MGKLTESLDAIEKCIQLMPENENFYKEKALLLYKLAIYEKALEAINKALEICPTYIIAFELNG